MEREREEGVRGRRKRERRKRRKERKERRKKNNSKKNSHWLCSEALPQCLARSHKALS